jgi:gas vesicle protein
MARDDSSFFELTFCFLLGGVVGATLALLYAPATGEQTRRRIREATDEVGGNVKEEVERLRDKAESEISRLKDRASEGVNQAKSYYETKKSRVREAYDQGKKQFQEDQERQEVASPTPANRADENS